MANLTLFTGRNAGRSFELTNDVTIIGRQPDCDLVLPEGTISRRHARIVRRHGEYYIEDLRSRNGTFVNEEPVRSPRKLQEGDQIRVDVICLTFHEKVEAGSAELESIDERVARPLQLVQDEGKLERSSDVVTSLDVIGPPDQRITANAEAKLRAVLQIVRNVRSSLDMDQVLPKILQSVFQIFPQADRGYILLREGPEGQLMPAAIQQRGDETGARLTIRPIARTIANRVLSERKAILSTDATNDERFQLSRSVLEMEVRSMMCAPLLSGTQEPLGIIHIDTQDPNRQFSADDLDVLVSVATLAGQAVDNARLHEQILRRERQEQELTTAKEVQLQLLPQRQPEPPGYQFFDYYRAAADVGGDYYGYISLPNDRLAIAVGDVAGKGMAAALLMSRLNADVRYCLVTTPTPADAVDKLNEQYSREVIGNRFITFALCVLDLKKHEVVIVNAGHVPPLFRSAETGTVEPIGMPAAGVPLGLDPRTQYAQFSVSLGPGDGMVLYTDGVNEAMNSEGELYGLQRLRQVIADAPADAEGPPSAEAIGRAVLDDVRQFMRLRPQHDDLCLLCFTRR